MRSPQTELTLKHMPALGATILESGALFKVYSHSATAVRLLLYDHQDDREPAEVLTFPEHGRTGDIWSCAVRGVGHGQLYHLQADGPHTPETGQRFDPRARLIDPYALALAGDFQIPEDDVLLPPKCVVIDDQFDWEGDRLPNHQRFESVIYELHVRGFTKSPTSKVKHPGTYLGLIEKIPYLQSLGITAVELMPVHEFPILGCDGRPLKHGNFWGYDPMAFFAPHRGYAVSREPGAQVTEFKMLVKALHRAGIEVILDVVFNHTCEGNEHGPVLSFKGLENEVYYLTANGGRHYHNYSGCGNTVRCNHPVVREMILECLRHWALEYHVDGFRFDLASILGRHREGHLEQNTPLVEAITEDAVLADRKMIAEAWDAAGAYQVGSFGGPRWAEWNGRYRDDVRRFWRGEHNQTGPLATRLAGSSDLYQRNRRHPHCSINFITAHDGFTLNDLVSYRHKHNSANGEGGHDGERNNHSEHYGVEGRTECRELEDLRERQIKNMLTTLLLSQGVPMLLGGDECRRTQSGNNNAYCQDNEISWFDWTLTETHAGLLAFYRELVNFRRHQATIRRCGFLTGDIVETDGRPDVSWFDPLGGAACWHGAPLLTCLLLAPPPKDPTGPVGHHLLLFLNATSEYQEFVVPSSARRDAWQLFVDTAARAPRDIFPDLDGPPPPANGHMILTSRSLRCYVAKA